MNAVRVDFGASLCDARRGSIRTWLLAQGLGQAQGPHHHSLLVLDTVDPAGTQQLRALAREASVLAVVMSAQRPTTPELWSLLEAGAIDVLWWPSLPGDADAVRARLARRTDVQDIVDSPRVTGQLVGRSVAWRQLLAHVVEIARFSGSTVLIQGESGTGKELIARLIHDLDDTHSAGSLVVVDCTTLTPELSGSELFGHERGAFTGALNAREGAFALAHGGTLFLDEVGDLPLPLQAQLLRVVQEHKFKRVGGNSWQHTDFRLVAATHRNLAEAVNEGSFRADLYSRLAGVVCRTPSLSERRDDVLSLAEHFQTEHGQSGAGFDDAVRQYLVERNYPGNVRDLRRVVTWLCQRHAGPGPVTLGAIPPDERPQPGARTLNRLDALLEEFATEALSAGLGMKEVAARASEAIIRCALQAEGGSLHRAAQRLGVTDRALQMRKAQQLNGASGSP